jgi:hypothetical protein
MKWLWSLFQDYMQELASRVGHTMKSLNGLKGYKIVTIGCRQGNNVS